MTAGNPYIASHCGQRACRSVVLLPEGGPPRCPTGIKGGWFEGSVVPGQLLCGFSGHAGNILGPLRRFWHPVLVTDDIILEWLKSHSVSFNEVMVVKVLVEHDIGHGNEQGSVRPRLYGNPLLSQGLRRNGVPRVNADNFGAGFFRPGQIVDGVRAESSNYRVPAPHDD